jgi:pilus assembly protein Flp/PilA
MGDARKRCSVDEASTSARRKRRANDGKRSIVLSATDSSNAAGYTPGDASELVRLQLRREEGQTMTEYGVLLALIAVVVIVALLVLGPKIAAVFTNVAGHL